MSTEAVRYEASDAIGVITLNRPDNRNSMTAEVLDGVARATAAAKADRSVRCVVITGTGKSFSAGADFKSMVQRSDGELHERSYAMYAPFLTVLDLDVPVIAAINGHAIGGGFGLALLCDLRIAATTAKYGANFVRLGLAPGMAISYVLPRLVGVSRAADLMFTGRLIDGDEARQIGLVSECHAPEAVLPRAMEIATTIAANAPLAVRFTKANLYRGLGWDPRAHAAREAVDQAATLLSRMPPRGSRRSSASVSRGSPVADVRWIASFFRPGGPVA
jgi:enoyl-CoA hydratase/carnithine racemase